MEVQGGKGPGLVERQEGQGRNRWEGFWGGRRRWRRGKGEITEGLIHQRRHLVPKVAAGLPKEPPGRGDSTLGGQTPCARGELARVLFSEADAR